MSNLTLGGALEQPCERYHNVRYITLEGLSSNHEKYIFRRRALQPVCAASKTASEQTVTHTTLQRLDSAARLCETRTIGTTERKELR